MIRPTPSEQPPTSATDAPDWWLGGARNHQQDHQLVVWRLEGPISAQYAEAIGAALLAHAGVVDSEVASVEDSAIPNIGPNRTYDGSFRVSWHHEAVHGPLDARLALHQVVDVFAAQEGAALMSRFEETTLET